MTRFVIGLRVKTGLDTRNLYITLVLILYLHPSLTTSNYRDYKNDMTKQGMLYKIV
jgi:hypothetical protein